jgi:hypothetical protein
MVLHQRLRECLDHLLIYVNDTSARSWPSTCSITTSIGPISRGSKGLRCTSPAKPSI